MSIPDYDLCKNLRWKSQARVSGDPAAAYASLVRSQVPFSCLQTGHSVGPDDDLVVPEHCCAERSCFVRMSAPRVS